MQRLISSDMAITAGSRRAALGIKAVGRQNCDLLAAQFHDKSPFGDCDPNQSATNGIVPTLVEGKHPALPSFSPDRRRPVMSTFREKAQARTKQMVGQMIGDEQLVEEGKEQERKAEQPAKSPDEHSEDASRH
jgi:hypothetical protein